MDGNNDAIQQYIYTSALQLALVEIKRAGINYYLENCDGMHDASSLSAVQYCLFRGFLTQIGKLDALDLSIFAHCIVKVRAK